MRAFVGLIVGIFISILVVNFTGESGVKVAGIILKSAFGSWDDFAMTLYYSTSLIFTGLSVCVAFHAGLFNIGAEGQLTMAAVGASAVGIFLPMIPYPLAPLVALITAMLAGAAWGMIPGFLKAFRGSHEVINTMMLNFIAAGIMTWLLRSIMKNPNSMNTESASMAESFLLRKFPKIANALPHTPFNNSFFLAVIAAVALYFLLYKTIWGFELRVVGQNDDVAEISGINPKKYKIIAMSVAGALAGMVCMNEVFGSAGRLKDGFSPGYGFTGIAVALLARNNPIGIIASAFLFGALQKGAMDLDFETKYINKDFAKIIQAIILFSVASFYFLTTERVHHLLNKIERKLEWMTKA